MKRADHCTVCNKTLDEMFVQIEEQRHRMLFCSWECVVTYSVGRIRQRLEQRSTQVRLFARDKKRSLHAARHSKRGGRSTPT